MGPLVLAMASVGASSSVDAVPAEKLRREQELLQSIRIRPEQLRPLRLETDVVRDGQPRAVICHAAAPAWRRGAEAVRAAVKEATGADLEVVADTDVDPAQLGRRDLILLGHLDNSRLVERLYHSFFVCLDVGYTGRDGYVVRSVHDPFGHGGNVILVGGSYPEGTAKAAKAFARIVRERGRTGELQLGRLLELQFDPTDRQEEPVPRLTARRRDDAVRSIREMFASPGRGRSGVARLVESAVCYHRTGDPLQGELYRAGLLAMLEYYGTDEYIRQEGLARYDRDFRDSWTHSVCITWDLLEESGLFSDEERLAATNLLGELALECVLYQGWNRPDIQAHWAANDDIVHNHNTFPALGVHFVGTYFKRHYGSDFVDNWLAVARGIFQGQKHVSKPLEDAAAYQWLPLMHTMIYTQSLGDDTFFAEGHAAESAKAALAVMDNAGFQAAFGDHSGYTSSSGIGSLLQRIAWKTRDPGALWGARRAVSGAVEQVAFNLGQPYFVDLDPAPPPEHEGIAVAGLPRKCYDYAGRSPQYATAPNLPWEACFSKLAFRGGFEVGDEYMLLDGFGRGTHMHFDANAIIRYSAGGTPLLVDGEYILNAPKHHNSLVIIRDGEAELTPAVAGLRQACFLDETGVARTYLTSYNGTEWERTILWRRGEYFLVCDTVTALTDGDFTLRCCWRPWGEAVLQEGTLSCLHPPMRLVIANADGAASRLERVKEADRLPISRLSQQVSRRLAKGAAYRFVNLLHAEAEGAGRQFNPRCLPGGITLIDGPEGVELAASGPTEGTVPGLRTDAEALLLSPSRLAFVGGRSLHVGSERIRASTPVSVELVSSSGSGVVVADTACEVGLRVRPGTTVQAGTVVSTAGADGMATVSVPAGRHRLTFEPDSTLPGVLDCIRAAEAIRPASGAAGASGSSGSALPSAWHQAAFEPPKEVLPVASVSCAEPHQGRYGPVEKLVDGECSSSLVSVMWPGGVTATITLGLRDETPVSSVVLREWHMSGDWDIGARSLEISSDGFADDVRRLGSPFEEAGTQRWGGNINTLMSIPVGQRARQLRLTVSPAREDSKVYLAEVEVHGTRPGRSAETTAVATGRLGVNGDECAVAASETGEIRAFTADGQALWSRRLAEGSAVHALACADVDGDGRDEVVYGSAGARLGLLSADGADLWQVEPPVFRGIPGDVMTVFAADVNGDGRPEIVCGCRNWQYFAYDKAGSMLWKHVIYAHSATVGCAVDLDGDGKEEVVAGNAYYQLNIIDHDGTRFSRADRFGPEQTAVAAGILDTDGTPSVLVGTDGGELICFDPQGKRRWTANVGDKVTRILVLPARGARPGRVSCAAESAHVFCFGATGTLEWRTAVGDGVTDLAVFRTPEGDRLAAAAGAEGLVVVDSDGAKLAVGRTRGRAVRLAVIGSRAIVSTDRGELEAFVLAPGE